MKFLLAVINVACIFASDADSKASTDGADSKKGDDEVDIRKLTGIDLIHRRASMKSQPKIGMHVGQDGSISLELKHGDTDMKSDEKANAESKVVPQEEEHRIVDRPDACSRYLILMVLHGCNIWRKEVHHKLIPFIANPDFHWLMKHAQFSATMLLDCLRNADKATMKLALEHKDFGQYLNSVHIPSITLGNTNAPGFGVADSYGATSTAPDISNTYVTPLMFLVARIAFRGQQCDAHGKRAAECASLLVQDYRVDVLVETKCSKNDKHVTVFEIWEMLPYACRQRPSAQHFKSLLKERVRHLGMITQNPEYPRMVSVIKKFMT